MIISTWIQWMIPKVMMLHNQLVKKGCRITLPGYHTSFYNRYDESSILFYELATGYLLLTIRIFVFNLLCYWMRSRSIFQINHAFLTWFGINSNDVSLMCLMISSFSSILFLSSMFWRICQYKKYRFLSIDCFHKTNPFLSVVN